MASLADLPNLVGFFSYSRNDDEGDDGAVAALANRIYRELRSQLGRTDKHFKLWRDKDALAAGEHWKEKLNEAVSESVFFIQLVTPSAVNSGFCRFEFESFIEREKELGCNDLVFPILYISVPQLEDIQTSKDPVISMAAQHM
jgi:cobaltochelatase CobT